MKKRTSLFLAFLLVLTMGLSAIGAVAEDAPLFDFGGKKLTLAFPYAPAPSTYRMIEDYNAAYNANMEIVLCDWVNFATDMATAMTSGSPYDVAFFHTEFYPQMIIANVMEPLDDVIQDSYYVDPADPSKGGITHQMADAMAFEGKIYAAGSNYSVFPYMLYYNKVIFNDLGLEDPLELYNNGEWTWEKMVEMGQEVTDPSTQTYFLGGFGNMNNFFATVGVSSVERDGDNFVENMKSEEVLNTINAYKELYIGDNAISPVDENAGDYFTNGTLAMKVDYTDAYSSNADTATNSNAFGKSADNLGIVPLPTHPLNTQGTYPGHAAQGWGAGKGTETPEAAVALAIFQSTWVDSEEAAYAIPADAQAAITKTLEGTIYTNIMGFQDSDGRSVFSIVNSIGQKIREGNDVISSVEEIVPAIEKAISDTLN